MQQKYRRLREEAYARGLVEYDELILLPTFRDFVVLYIAEGFKRRRNCVSISNSDPRVVALSASWLSRATSGVLLLWRFCSILEPDLHKPSPEAASLRARLQAWIDRVREDWRLDSAQPSGRSSAW